MTLTSLRLGFTTLCLLSFLPLLVRAEENTKAKEVIQAAIEAMGGQRYLQVQSKYAEGRYFPFDKRERRRGFVRFLYWTVYEPIKSRFQLGKDEKSRTVEIHNMEINKGWVLEGEDSVEEIPEEDLRKWRKSVQRDIHLLLRNRVDEEGMNLFYYGPDDVVGTGEHEAVEFVDASNDAIVVFFDLQSQLPSKMEFHTTNRMGVRLKSEIEFHNWHTIQGVHTPLRHDHFLEGKRSLQLFLEEVSYNIRIPAERFLEPQAKN